MTADNLVAEHIKIDDYLSSEIKRFQDFCKPYRDRLSEIEGHLLELMQEQGVKSVKTDHGTSYISTITTPAIKDREAFLDAVMDNYDTWGAGMLQLGKPKKEALDAYMAENGNVLPAGIETTSFVRVNVRRT
jgi:hypothetical protein